MDENALILSGKDKETGTPSEIFIPREKIHEVFLGWDDVLRRWKDTRAWIHPSESDSKRTGKQEQFMSTSKNPKAQFTEGKTRNYMKN